jgi:hypothetical protein
MADPIEDKGSLTERLEEDRQKMAIQVSELRCFLVGGTIGSGGTSDRGDSDGPIEPFVQLQPKGIPKQRYARADRQVRTLLW